MIDNSLTRRLACLLKDTLIVPDRNSVPVVNPDLAHHAGTRHRIAPLLHSLAKERHLEVDPVAEKFLRDSYRYAGLQAAQQARVRSQIKAVMASDDIEYIELKGRGLAEQLYSDPVGRFSKDVDILVNHRDGSRALSRLMNAGFIARSKKKGRINKFAKCEMWALKDTSLCDPQFGQQVELHSRLLQSEPATMSAEFIKSNNAAPHPQISNPFYAFYLLMHGAQCHWASLKWLLDLALLISRTRLPPDSVFEIARSFHSLSAVSASIEFIDLVFQDSVPQAWMQLARQFRTARSVKLCASFHETLCHTPPRKRHAGYPFVDWYIYDGGLDYRQAIPRRLITPFFRFV